MTRRKRRINLWVVALILFYSFVSFSACAQENIWNKGYSAIDEENLKAHIQYLASDELSGRFAYSEDYLKAADYVQSQMINMGLLPGNPDGSYFQRFQLHRIGPDPIKQFSVITPDESLVFKYGKDFIAGTGWCNEAGEVNLLSDIVFVGYGIVAPEFHYNDYQDLDVKGKVVVMLPGEPDYEDMGIFQKIITFFKKGSRYKERKVWNALDKEVRGIINISETKSGSKKWKEKIARMEKSSGFAVSPTGKDCIAKDYRFYFQLNYEAGDLLLKKLLGSGLQSFNKKEFSIKNGLIKDAYIEIKGNYSQNPFPSMNVVAKIQGYDPDPNDEYIILGAHIDHIGRRKGKVCPGADDNASGCAALLEIGRASLMGEKPKRSIVLLFFSAEEIGGKGSYYYTEHPLVPLEKTKAMVNLDCVGRNGAPDKDPNTIYLIGSEKYSSQLKDICKKVNKQTEHFTISHYYDEKGKKPLLSASDHYNFNRKEIPILFFHSGQHRDLHRPSDTEDKIDYNKLARVCRLVYSTTLYLANLDNSFHNEEQTKLQAIIDKQSFAIAAF